MFFPMLAIHQFQSTHPARGATERGRGKTWEHPYFNPRTPRGVRPRASSMSPVRLTISIHAPREGCDSHIIQTTSGVFGDFNPRTPRGVRPGPPPGRTGGGDFNPRTPRGVRPTTSCPRKTARRFQSTHPARGATTQYSRLYPFSPRISIHAPREGCDSLRMWYWMAMLYFNPRTPRGVRHGLRSPPTGSGNFNPRTPRGVRRTGPHIHRCPEPYFNPRTPRGVRPRVW